MLTITDDLLESVICGIIGKESHICAITGWQTCHTMNLELWFPISNIHLEIGSSIVRSMAHVE